MPTNTHPRMHFPRMALLAVVLLTVAQASQSAAQARDTDFDAVQSSADVPCPPSFPAIYVDNVFGRFFGKSQFTMRQWDETHTYEMFTYYYKGETPDGKTRVTGIHHVNIVQCGAAAYSYWSGSPAYIARLHNATFFSVACSGGGGDPVAVVYDPYAEEDSTDCDAGGSDGDEGSGTPYEPGDHTGGETVDWGTGRGNGGTSLCGESAVVEYVCIDVYNEKTGRWDKWSCGYATTC